MYEERFYRDYLKPSGFVSCRVVVEEADIVIYSAGRLPGCGEKIVRKYYQQVADTIAQYPEFATALSPLNITSNYPLVKAMLAVSQRLGVGPMATVAGAIAEFCGRELLADCSQIIVENGGDIFLAKKGEIRIFPFLPGKDFLADMVLVVPEKNYPLGICSSSAVFGHSLSLGTADLATVISRSALFSDGLSTLLANKVKSASDVEKTLAWGRQFDEVEGLLIVKDDKVGLWGDVELRRRG